jgi:DNA-binding MarR family transcriptional regulator
MYEKREVTRDTDPKDWRRSYYSMTPTGWDEYRKQRDVESLNSMEFLRIGYMMGAVKALVMDFIKAYEVGVESAYPEGIPQLGEEGKTILKECLTLSFYSEPLENKRVRPMQALTELIQSVNALATSKNVDLRHLKQIPNLTVVFGFNRDKLIEEYLKKTGAA